MLRFPCPQCAHPMKAVPGAAGCKTRCSKCNATFTIPAAELTPVGGPDWRDPVDEVEPPDSLADNPLSFRPAPRRQVELPDPPSVDLSRRQKPARFGETRPVWILCILLVGGAMAWFWHVASNSEHGPMAAVALSNVFLLHIVAVYVVANAIDRLNRTA